MAVRVVSLGSGSRGNATLVEFGDRRLLVDAGFSARDLGRRLQGVGVDPGSLDLILLTHEHWDHRRGLERFSGLHNIPVACTPATLEAMNLSHIHLPKWYPLKAGKVEMFDTVSVDPFPVPHDAADPVGFVLQEDGVRIGIATDLGHATTLVKERLRGCRVLLVEANHDENMLRDGPYPWHLKQRVGGRLGHLSNRAAAAMVGSVADRECRAVILGHISEKNNTAALARESVAGALAAAGMNRIEMRISRQEAPMPPVIV